MVKRGRGLGHVTYFSNFGTPNISGMVEDTNLKLCMWIDRKGTAEVTNLTFCMRFEGKAYKAKK